MVDWSLLAILPVRSVVTGLLCSVLCSTVRKPSTLPVTLIHALTLTYLLLSPLKLSHTHYIMAAIPLAYDGDTRQVHPVPRSDAPLLVDGVSSSDEVSSEMEARWKEEMAEQGIGHLPVEWYRQTPGRAIKSGYGIANIIISALINFGINTGLGYAILHNNDQVGLWHEPDVGEHPYKSAAWSDLILTTICIAYFTCLLSTKGIRDAMKKGLTVPVENEALRRGCFRFSPIRMLGTCTRSILLSAWACVVICIPFIILLEIVCVSGGMTGGQEECAMQVHTYIYLKATYSMVCAAIVYPFVLLATLNTETLPPLDLTFFATNQKERWDKKMREEAEKRMDTSQM